jgi:hypothetical protein
MFFGGEGIGDAWSNALKFQDEVYGPIERQWALTKKAPSVLFVKATVMTSNVQYFDPTKLGEDVTLMFNVEDIIPREFTLEYLITSFNRVYGVEESDTRIIHEQLVGVVECPEQALGFLFHLTLENLGKAADDFIQDMISTILREVKACYAVLIMESETSPRKIPCVISHMETSEGFVRLIESTCTRKGTVKQREIISDPTKIRDEAYMHSQSLFRPVLKDED